MLFGNNLAEIREGAFDQARHQVEIRRVEQYLAAIRRDDHLNRPLGRQDARQLRQRARRNKNIAAWVIIAGQGRHTHRQAEGIGGGKGQPLVAHLHQHTR